MKTTPFKNRQIDLSKPVHVYLHFTKNVFSVKQGNHVVAHADRLHLRDVRYHVRPGGRDKVRATGQKNVHAFVIGYLIESADLRAEEDKYLSDPNDVLPYVGVSYNPKHNKRFVRSGTSTPILYSDWADLDVESDMKVMAIFTPENQERDWPAESVTTV